jgi:predicted nucleic acid-binding protein
VILVVADTSPIHYLILIDAIDVLPRLYDRLVLPEAVYAELSHPRAPKPVQGWIHNLPFWAEVKLPASVTPVDKLDRGELEAIALATEMNAASLLLDEWEARQEAIRLRLPVTGTIGILEKDAERGLLNLSEAVGRLLQTNFRISADLVSEITSRNAELGR